MKRLWLFFIILCNVLAQDNKWILKSIQENCPDIGDNEVCDGGPFTEFTIRGSEGDKVDDGRWWWENVNTLGLSNYDRGSNKSGSFKIVVRNGYEVKIKFQFETEGERNFIDEIFPQISTTKSGILERGENYFITILEGGDQLSVDIDDEWTGIPPFFLKVQGKVIVHTNKKSESIDDEVFVELLDVTTPFIVMAGLKRYKLKDMSPNEQRNFMTVLDKSDPRLALKIRTEYAELLIPSLRKPVVGATPTNLNNEISSKTNNSILLPIYEYSVDSDVGSYSDSLFLDRLREVKYYTTNNTIDKKITDSERTDKEENFFWEKKRVRSFVSYNPEPPHEQRFLEYYVFKENIYNSPYLVPVHRKVKEDKFLGKTFYTYSYSIGMDFGKLETAQNEVKSRQDEIKIFLKYIQKLEADAKKYRGKKELNKLNEAKQKYQELVKNKIEELIDNNNGNAKGLSEGSSKEELIFYILRNDMGKRIIENWNYSGLGSLKFIGSNYEKNNNIRTSPKGPTEIPYRIVTDKKTGLVVRDKDGTILIDKGVDYNDVAFSGVFPIDTVFKMMEGDSTLYRFMEQRYDRYPVQDLGYVLTDSSESEIKEFERLLFNEIEKDKKRLANEIEEGRKLQSAARKRQINNLLSVEKMVEFFVKNPNAIEKLNNSDKSKMIISELYSLENNLKNDLGLKNLVREEYCPCFSSKDFNEDAFLGVLLSMKNPTEAEVAWLESFFTKTNLYCKGAVRNRIINDIVNIAYLRPTWEQVVEHYGGYSELAKKGISENQFQEGKFDLRAKINNVQLIDKNNCIINIEISGNVDFHKIDPQFKMRGKWVLKDPSLFDLLNKFNSLKLEIIPETLKFDNNLGNTKLTSSETSFTVEDTRFIDLHPEVGEDCEIETTRRHIISNYRVLVETLIKRNISIKDYKNLPEIQEKIRQINSS